MFSRNFIFFWRFEKRNKICLGWTVRNTYLKIVIRIFQPQIERKIGILQPGPKNLYFTFKMNALLAKDQFWVPWMACDIFFFVGIQEKGLWQSRCGNGKASTCTYDVWKHPCLPPIKLTLRLRLPFYRRLSFQSNKKETNVEVLPSSLWQNSVFGCNFI